MIKVIKRSEKTNTTISSFDSNTFISEPIYALSIVRMSVPHIIDYSILL